MSHLAFKPWFKRSLVGISLGTLPIGSAFASSLSNLPFTSTMNLVKDAISGPFLLAAAVIMMVITCLMLAFGEWGDGFKKMINIVLWLSVAFAATNFITSLFGSGAVF